MSVQTFNPNELFIAVGGVLLSGFAEQIVTVERDQPVAFDERGTEGEIIRYLSEDRRGDITFTLLATSPGNLVLSTFVNADELTGVQVFPVIIRDGAGNALDLVVAPLCWVRAHAPISYSKGVEVRPWVIRSTSIRILEGRISDN